MATQTSKQSPAHGGKTKHVPKKTSGIRKAKPQSISKQPPVSMMKRIGEKIFGEPEVVTQAKLIDFLSEFLAVEKGGVELYSGAVKRSTDPKIKKQFTEYLAQTRRHAELLTKAMREIAGDPDYESPGAKIQMQRAESMLELKVPEELRELADAENLLIAETKDHADWEFLGKISSKIQDEKARSIVEDMVSEVEDQEDEHLKFARQAVDELTMKLALSASENSEARRSTGAERAA